MNLDLAQLKSLIQMGLPEPRDISLQKFAWGRGWIGPYESAYTILQKYSWANLLRPSQLCRELFDTIPAEMSFSGVHARSLLTGLWIPNASQPHLVPTDATFRHRCLSAYTPRWACALASDRYFRFCPSCLLRGYQSAIFQIEGLSLCPIHGDALSNRCQSCGRSTPRYALENAGFLQPFRCQYCGEALAGDFKPELWFDTVELHSAAAKRLKPLADWLRRLDASPYSWPVYRGKSSEWFSHKNLTGTHIPAEIQAFHIARQLVHLHLKETLLARPSLPSRLVAVNTRLCPEGESHTGRITKWPECVAIYKAIKRYLIRHYLKGHRRCIADASRNVNVIIGSPYANLWTEGCPLALAFLLWRLRSEGWINPSYRSGNFPALVFQKGVMSTPFIERDRDFKLWAWAQLAAFFACAAIVTRFILDIRSFKEFKDPSKLHRVMCESSHDLEQYLDIKHPPLDNEMWLLEHQANDDECEDKFLLLCPSSSAIEPLLKLVNHPKK